MKKGPCQLDGWKPRGRERQRLRGSCLVRTVYDDECRTLRHRYLLEFAFVGVAASRRHYGRIVSRALAANVPCEAAKVGDHLDDSILTEWDARANEVASSGHLSNVQLAVA